MEYGTRAQRGTEYRHKGQYGTEPIVVRSTVREPSTVRWYWTLVPYFVPYWVLVPALFGHATGAWTEDDAILSTTNRYPKKLLLVP